MKMISRILLLLILSSCLCAATFVVNVTQSSYQAEENHSITLEWTFTTNTQGTWSKLLIDCSLLTPHRRLFSFQFHEGVEFPDSQHEHFSGRVQSDKDVLREGRIRLNVSRLRTEDSGLYRCEVKTEDGSNNAACRLNVTAAADVCAVQRTTLDPDPEGQGLNGPHDSLGLTTAAAADVSPTQRTTLDPEPEGRGRIGLHVSLLLTAAAAAALMVKLFLTLRSKG